MIRLAKDVHRVLGPGYSEAVYHRAMEAGLRQRTVQYQSEVILPVTYMGTNCGNVRADLIVAKQLVVELKAVRKMAMEDTRIQTQNYMRLLGIHEGLMLNFGSKDLEVGHVLTAVDYGAASTRPGSA